MTERNLTGWRSLKCGALQNEPFWKIDLPAKVNRDLSSGQYQLVATLIDFIGMQHKVTAKVKRDDPRQVLILSAVGLPMSGTLNLMYQPYGL